MILVTELTRSLMRWINDKLRAVMCTEAAVVMAAHTADPLIPSNPASPETDALHLYRLGGHTANGGRTRAQIIQACRIMWGHEPRIATSPDDALAAVRNGASLAVAVDYYRLPRRLKIGGAFGRLPGAWHEMKFGPILEEGTDPVLFVGDPLGKKPGYKGGSIRWSDLVRAMLGPKDGAGVRLGDQILIFDRNAWKEHI